MGMIMGPVPAKRPIKKETVRRIAATFSPYKPQVAMTAVAVIGAAGLGLLSPFFLQVIVNRGLLGRDMGVVASYSIYTLAATITSTALSLAYGYLSTVVGQRIMRDLRNQLYD